MLRGRDGPPGSGGTLFRVMVPLGAELPASSNVTLTNTWDGQRQLDVGLCTAVSPYPNLNDSPTYCILGRALLWHRADGAAPQRQAQPLHS